MKLLPGRRDVNPDILDNKRTSVTLVCRYGWTGGNCERNDGARLHARYSTEKLVTSDTL